MVITRFQTNPGSVIISDYCYNRYNSGIPFDKHLFIYMTKSTYKYIGENYPYTGLIYHKPRGEKYDSIVVEWDAGRLTLFSTRQTDKEQDMGIAQIKKLYEEYLDILRFEMHVLGFKATELRHLIGRLGEFFCVLYTKGSLSKVTNQQG